MSKVVSISRTQQSIEPVDSAERLRALDPNASFLVQAPAGSGKTGLLVQRMLRLLSVVERPESIVAVTFTIKAAREMRNRVVSALADADSDLIETGTFAGQTAELARSALARDRELGWQLLDDPSRLHIQTIDALCGNLVRQMPLVSDSGGIGNVTEDADPLYRQAARRALRRLADPVPGGAAEQRAMLRRLALHFDNNIKGLETQIVAMLGKRDQWHGSPSVHDLSPVADFHHVLHLAESELRDVFRQHNTVDFIEITRAAIKALGEPEAPSDLLYTLDYRIEHLLVDEFQDTSRAQYRLLSALTGQWSDGDGRTLFLVGDPLQSIYGFRAAEVSLFQQCWDEERLDAVRLNRLRLRTNFRSRPEIVNWVQTELTPVFGAEDRATGAVALQPSTAAREDGGVHPCLIPLLDDRDSAQEADEVVRIVQRLKSRSKAAILVRSRAHVTAILRSLRRAGIPYCAVEIDPLGEQQHVLDLLALTRALTHLGDRAAWLACLRAPWCGLKLADLTSLAENKSDRTILELLSDPSDIAGLNPDGRTRAVRVGHILAHAVELAGRISLRQLVSQTWFALGGPSILAQQNQREDAETFLALVEELEQGGLIRDFGVLTERCAQLYARPDASPDAVQVMTIHEAKGLEFDAVVLPHIAGQAKRDEGDLLVWSRGIDGELEVAAQPQRGSSDPEYDRICDLRKQKEANEGKRLFYVACTRAKNELFLLGSAKPNAAGTDLQKANKYSFLGMIWDRAKPQFLPLLRRADGPTQADLFEGFTVPRTIGRLPVGWRVPAFASAVRWDAAFQRSTASERRITYEWVGGASRHVGTVVHGILNEVARQGLSAWSDSRITALQSSVREELLRLGLDASVVSKATKQALQALNTTLSSPRGQWILRDRPHARSEWPISGLLDGKLIAGTVDRLFRDDDKDGRLWIIDYKVSAHSGGQTSEFLERELSRYREQMENYGRLLRTLETGPISLGLYFPLLDGWQEWEFAETAASGI